MEPNLLKMTCLYRSYALESQLINIPHTHMILYYSPLLKPTENERKDIFKLLSKRRKKSSTIFCAQYKPEGWYEQLGGSDETLADAILDRIVHDSYVINIEPIDPSKDISMREVYGVDKSIAQ